MASNVVSGYNTSRGESTRAPRIRRPDPRVDTDVTESNGANETTPAAAPARGLGQAGWIAALVVGGLVLGAAARYVSLSYAPYYSYKPDHVDFMAWARYAHEAPGGPYSMYDFANRLNNRAAAVVFRAFNRDEDDQWTHVDQPVAVPHSVNYPAGAGYIFWMQGWLWNQINPPPPDAPTPNPNSPRLPPDTRPINTLGARFVIAAPGMVFDFLMAAGVAALVWSLRREAANRIPEALGFTVTLLLPPVFLDTAFWGQADSWVTAALVWTVVLLVRRQFLLAGLVLGVGATLKPQVVLLAPVIVFVGAALWLGRGGSWMQARRILRTLVVAALTIVVVAAPFMWNDGRKPYQAFQSPADKAWRGMRWIERSYVSTIGQTGAAASYRRITLSAFNVWWLKYTNNLRAGQRGAEALNAEGVSGVGTMLLGLAVLAAYGLCAWRWRWGPEGWVALTCAVLVAAFALPTGVHERYVFYCLPFLVAMAVRRPLWWIPLVGLSLVGTFEMTSFMWVFPEKKLIETPAYWYSSVALAWVTVLSLLAVYGLLWLRPREEDASPA